MSDRSSAFGNGMHHVSYVWYVCKYERGLQHLHKGRHDDSERQRKRLVGRGTGSRHINTNSVRREDMDRYKKREQERARDTETGT